MLRPATNSGSKDDHHDAVEMTCVQGFALRRKSFPAERTYQTQSFPAKRTYFTVARCIKERSCRGTETRQLQNEFRRSHRDSICDTPELTHANRGPCTDHMEREFASVGHRDIVPPRNNRGMEQHRNFVPHFPLPGSPYTSTDRHCIHRTTVEQHADAAEFRSSPRSHCSEDATEFQWWPHNRCCYHATECGVLLRNRSRVVASIHADGRDNRLPETHVLFRHIPPEPVPAEPQDGDAPEELLWHPNPQTQNPLSMPDGWTSHDTDNSDPDSEKPSPDPVTVNSPLRANHQRYKHWLQIHSGPAAYRPARTNVGR